MGDQSDVRETRSEGILSPTETERSSRGILSPTSVATEGAARGRSPYFQIHSPLSTYASGWFIFLLIMTIFYFLLFLYIEY